MSRKKTGKSGPFSAGRLPMTVYKLGGPALEDPELIAPLAAELHDIVGNVAVVHGGGRFVERVLSRLGVASRFVDGRRATSPEAMQVVEMVLSGSVNKSLAARLTAAGVPAAGLSGRDAGLLHAEPVEGLGRVGHRVRVNPEALLALWRSHLVPVVSPVANDAAHEPLNVNADEAALALAAALYARRLVFFSDVDGVRLAGEAAETLSAQEAAARVEDGTISGGMALKVRTALEAARAGVPEVVIAGKARLTGGFGGTRILAGDPGEAVA